MKKLGFIVFDGKKFSELLKARGYTSKQFAEALKNVDVEITEASINAYRQNRADPRIAVLCGIAELLNLEEQDLLVTNRKKKHTSKEIAFSVPFIEINSPLNILSNLAQCPQLNIDPHIYKLENTDKVIAVKIIGDDMYPVFDKNDLILARLLDEDTIKGNNLYLIEYANIIQLKRIQYLSNDEIALISLNKDYPPISINKKDCQILGEILVKISVMIY